MFTQNKQLRIFCVFKFFRKKKRRIKMRKKLPCGCEEHGCQCENEVEVPEYVPDDSKVTCHDCANGRHQKSQPKTLKTTKMKKVKRNYFFEW